MEMHEISLRESGILFVVVEELRVHRLPRIVSIKKNVDNGKTLSDLDIEFLKTFF